MHSMWPSGGKQNKKNCMHFVEEHCFDCALALHVCVDEYDSLISKKGRDYPTAHKTLTIGLRD